MKPLHMPMDHQALEARLAARLASSLTMANAQLPHDIAERLRASRERALHRARNSHKLAATGATEMAATPAALGGSVTLGGPSAWSGLPAWLSALLPLLLLLAGLWSISHLTQREQIKATADIDAQLLSDDLPPAAYADPGFVQYLRRGSSQ